MESSRACGAVCYQIQKAFLMPSRVSSSMPAPTYSTYGVTRRRWL